MDLGQHYLVNAAEWLMALGRVVDRNFAKVATQRGDVEVGCRRPVGIGFKNKRAALPLTREGSSKGVGAPVGDGCPNLD